MEHKWIRFKDGQFGPLYIGDEINYFGTVLNQETPDEVLIDIGVYRLIQFSMDTPYTMITGPTYRLDGTGKALVYEEFEVYQHTIEDVKRNKTQELFSNRAAYLQNKFHFNGKTYDLRFRNLSYLAILSTLINNDRYPENFVWTTVDNEAISINKNEALDLIEQTAVFISDLEQKLIIMRQNLDALTDITEIANFDVTIT
jgi:hypothetical protein